MLAPTRMHTKALSLALLAGFGLCITACPDNGSDDPGGESSGTQADDTTSSSSTTATTSTATETTAPTSESSESTGEPNGDFDPVLLDCPFPRSLPFTTQSSDWINPDAQAIADANARIKDEGSDIVGNPGGPLAYTTMPQTDPPAPGLDIFEGRKQRTTNEEGLVAQPLVGENVSLWGYDGVAWTELDRMTTDAMGAYAFSGVPLSANPFQPYYAILEADQSCAPHYMFVLDPGTPIVLADIDGTLTLSDDELSMQIADGSYDPVENTAASTMMNAWADKGYVTVYLTARPHAFRAETREWLDDHGFPPGPVVTANTLVFGETARTYKATWVSRIITDLGWELAAAYGNADSDITAYEDAGIPKDITFIIGELAGMSGTQPIENNDYTDHIAEFVEPYPDA
jgi:hypothetical protein